MSDYLMALELQLTENSITTPFNDKPPPPTGQRGLTTNNNTSEDTYMSDHLMALELHLTENSITTPFNDKNVSLPQAPESDIIGPSGTSNTQIKLDPHVHNRNNAKDISNPTSRFQNDEGASMLVSDHEYALGRQRAFEHEQREIEEMHARLLVEYPEQKVFECGICLEMSLIDFATPIDGCEHVLCRNCLKNYVVSRLDEGRYPVVCPVCSADKIGQNPGCESVISIVTSVPVDPQCCSCCGSCC